MQGLFAVTEKDLADVAGKALAGDRKDAITTTATFVVSALTGHPAAGLLAGVFAGAIVDKATARLLEAEKQWDDERTKENELKGYLREILEDLFIQKREHDEEWSLQLIRWIERNVASSEDVKDASASLREAIAILRDLKRLTERPSVLSPVPPRGRSQRRTRLLGRDQSLNAILEHQSDLLLVGGPGLGKTSLLSEAAHDRPYYFVLHADRGTLERDVRELHPAAIIIDDAHAMQDAVLVARQVRNQAHATFRIIASCWDHDAGKIQRLLDLGDEQTVRLDLLDADTIVEVVKQAGLNGPDELVRNIVHQADGRPGLAVTLAELCIGGSVKKVLMGDALFEVLGPEFANRLAKDESCLLACFALGGAHGCSLAEAATFLNRALDDVRLSAVALSNAGVLREAYDGCLSVWPPPLRWTLMRSVFFETARLPYRDLLDKMHDREEALIALVGARSRGAVVPGLEQLLTAAATGRVWGEYAWLGPREARRVLTEHPNLVLELAPPLLWHAPEKAILALLDYGLDHPLSPTHQAKPFEQLEHWARDGQDDREMVRRSELLVDAAKRWDKKAEHPRLAISALCLALRPDFDGSAPDPGQGKTLRLSFGNLGDSSLLAVAALWPKVLEEIMLASDVPWNDVFQVIQRWDVPHPGIVRSASAATTMSEFVLTMVRDLAHVKHLGVQHRLLQFAKLRRLPCQCELDAEFGTLYPLDIWNGAQPDPRLQWIAGVERMALEWSSWAPSVVAERLSRYERQAAEAAIRAPRLVVYLCEQLAMKSPSLPEFVDCFVRSRLSGDLLYPFVDRLPMRLKIDWVRRLAHVPEYNHIALVLALADDGISDAVVGECISSVSAPGAVVEQCCFGRRLSERRMKFLLKHPVADVAIATALGEWKTMPTGQVRPELASEWRAAVLLSAHTFERSGIERFWVERILQDAALAVAWLQEVVAESKRPDYQTLEIAQNVANGLTNDQRLSVLERIKKGVGLEGIVEALVGDDLDLYARLLDREDLKSYHLAPLSGLPDDKWAQKIEMAGAAGYEDEDLLDATFPRAWTFCGPESAFWGRWAEAFRANLTHESWRVRRVAKAGQRQVESRIAGSQRSERLEAIRGLPW